MANIDLTAARETVEAILLTDRCDVVRPPDDRNAVFNDVTGNYEPQTQIPAVAIDEPCAVRERSLSESERGGMPEGTKVYDIKFVATFDGLQLGDVITLIASDDPTLVGVPLEITNIQRGTLRVLRTVQARTRESTLGLH